MNAFVVATILRTLLSSLDPESARDRDATAMPEALAPDTEVMTEADTDAIEPEPEPEPDTSKDATAPSRPDRIEVEVGNDPLAGVW